MNYQIAKLKNMCSLFEPFQIGEQEKKKKRKISFNFNLEERKKSIIYFLKIVHCYEDTQFYLQIFLFGNGWNIAEREIDFFVFFFVV